MKKIYLISIMTIILLASCDNLVTELEKSILESHDLLSNTLTVTTDAGGSVVTPNVTRVKLEDREETPIEITILDPAYTFDSWSQTGGTGTLTIDNSSLENTSVILTGGDATVNANLIAATYSMDVSVIGSGGVSAPSSSTVTVTHGVPYNIRATDPTARGVYFSGWSQTGGTGTADFNDAASRNTMVTVTDGPVDISANYSLINATLTYRGRYNLNGSAFTSERLTTANDVVVVGDFAYVGGISPAGGGQVLKIDISDPTSPGHDDNWSRASSEVRDMHFDGSNVSFALSSGTASTDDIYYFSNSNFSPVGMGFSSGSVSMTGGGSFFSYDGDDVTRYYSYDTWTGVDDINTIYYDPDYGRLYVTGNSGPGVQGDVYALKYNSGTDTIENDAAPYSNNSYITYDVQPNDIYLYVALHDGGLLTLFIDDDPMTEEDRDPRSAGTGNPLFLDLAGKNSNYLVALSEEYSSSTDGRLVVYDVHWNNDSAQEPLNIYDRGTVNTAVPHAMDVSGNYVYTIEGLYLTIYELVTNAD